MFRSDPSREKYQRKYEKELQSLLEQMIAQVDQKIKRSLNRIEIPGGSGTGSDMILPEMSALHAENTHDKIDKLEQKINFYIEKAERLGEEGKIDESDAIMKEVEKLKLQKLDLEAL